MTVIFDFKEATVGGGFEWDGPSDSLFYFYAFDPDHTGDADWLEWDFKARWEHVSGGGAETLSYKFQYLEDGGSWTDFDTGTTPLLAPGGYCIERNAGILETLITMPIDIRIIGTAANKWKLWYVGGDVYNAYMRAVGSVS